jgi:hypothetical protein
MEKPQRAMDSRARLGSSITQSPSQQLDVLLLVSGDLVDPAPSPVGEPGIDKVLVRELVEVLSVEGGFEVFEGPTGTCRKEAVSASVSLSDGIEWDTEIEEEDERLTRRIARR